MCKAEMMLFSKIIKIPFNNNFMLKLFNYLSSYGVGNVRTTPAATKHAAKRGGISARGRQATIVRHAAQVPASAPERFPNAIKAIAGSATILTFLEIWVGEEMLGVCSLAKLYARVI